MLRSIGKQCGESVESVRKKKRKATMGKICTKKKVLNVEWKSEGVGDGWWEWWVDGTDRGSATQREGLGESTLNSNPTIPIRHWIDRTHNANPNLKP